MAAYIHNPRRRMEVRRQNSRENLDPKRNQKATTSTKDGKKPNNVAITPKIKKSKTRPAVDNTRTRLPRACNEKGHVCNGQCITPLPTRLCSMSGRRKKRILAPIPTEAIEAVEQPQTQTEEKKDKKQWRNNLEGTSIHNG